MLAASAAPGYCPSPPPEIKLAPITRNSRLANGVQSSAENARRMKSVKRLRDALTRL